MTEEVAWWNDPPGGIEANAWGEPPYDVDAAADVIVDTLRCAGYEKAAVLDLGCGPGRTAMAVADRILGDVVGVDSSPAMIAATRDDLDQRFVLGDGRVIPEDIKFDYAYSITTFQHIPHSATLLYMAQVCRRLPLGGRFLFTHSPGYDAQAFLHHQCGPPQLPITWALEVGFNDAAFVDLPPELERVGSWKWYVAWV